MPVATNNINKNIVCLPLKSRTLPPALYTNTYIIGKPDNSVVFDLGAKDTKELIPFFQYVKENHCLVEKLILSHHHRDHIEGVPYAKKDLNIKVYIHHREGSSTILGLNQMVDYSISEGDYFDLETTGKIIVVHTPGHSHGSVSLYLEQYRILFCGDLLATQGTVVIDPEDGDLEDYLQSLNKLLDMEIDLILPAHGDPIVQPAQKIKETINHRLWREEKILQSLNKDGTTLEEIVKKAYTDVPVVMHSLAKLSTLAHIKRLKKHNQIMEERQNGIIVYRKL